jgi:hypothetical protein
MKSVHEIVLCVVITDEDKAELVCYIIYIQIHTYQFVPLFIYGLTYTNSYNCICYP